MKKEIWKPIKGYEGLYEVSNYGRIKNQFNHIRKLQINKFGYFRCILTKNGKQKFYFVHRLVAKAFIPNPNNLPFINHKDENKLNNFVYVNPDGTIDFEKSNLEWCTAKYNINYGSRKERVKTKTLNGKLAKPVLQFTLDGKFIAEYPSAREAERQTGIYVGNISACCKNKYGHKSAGGSVWKFKEAA